MSRNGKKCKTSFAVLEFQLYILREGTDDIRDGSPVFRGLSDMRECPSFKISCRAQRSVAAYEKEQAQDHSKGCRIRRS